MGELPHNKLCCLSEIFWCAVVCLTMAAFLHISWVVQTAGERRQCINRNNFNCRLLSDVRPNELSVSAFMDHLYVHASVKCWTVCVETVGNQRCCKKHTPIKLYLSCTSRICWSSSSRMRVIYHTVQQRPLLPREVETWLPDCGVTH